MPAARIPDSATLIAATDLLSTEFEEETVILNLRDGVYYSLDQAGARIWQLLQQGTSLPVIRTTITAEYDVSEERCEADIRQLTADLVAKGLVNIGEPG